MSAVLRPARPLDAGAAGDILYRYCQDTPWMPKLYSQAETIGFCGTMIDRNWMRVAEDDQGIAGFLARDGQEVCALYLVPRAQGWGLGRRLLAEAKAEMDRLSLHTFAFNTGAQQFYLCEGFRETGRGDGTGNDENLPDIAYLWEKEGPSI